MTGAAIALLGLGFIGCSTDSEEPSSALRDGTGTDWVIDEHPFFKTVSFALPKNDGVALPSAASPADAVLALLDRYRAVFGMQRPSQEWRLLSTSRAEDGSTHLRFTQQTRGVSVFGSDWIAALDRNGRLVSMSGVYVPGVDAVDLAPKLTVQQVTDAVANDVRKQDSGLDVRTRVNPTPLVYAAESVPPALAFRATSTAPGREDTTYTIDAHSGAILSRYSTNASAGGYAQEYGASHYPPYSISTDPKKSFPVSSNPEHSGSWLLSGKSKEGVRIQTSAYLQKPDQPISISETAPPSSEPPTEWEDDSVPRGAAVDAQANFAAVVDTYKKLFGRNSYDDRGADIFVALNPGQDEIADAHYRPNHPELDASVDCGGIFSFGAGDPSGLHGLGGARNPVYPLSASLTVVAHEFTHGISQCTWGGTVNMLSGGVSEAMSDILSMFVAADVVGGNPFLWGSGVGPRQGYLRNLSNPHDPNAWSAARRHCAAADETTCEMEVHALSMIISHAWFLMTIGGKHASTGQVVTCPLSWEASRKLWWAVETQDLPRGPDFRAVANATLSAGKRLGLPLDPIACAWVAVRIMTPEEVKTDYDVVCPGADAEAPDASSSSSGGLVQPTGPLLCPGPRPLTGG